ncbi:MAG: hypothetical protein LBK66_02020 [Spirochaetaceae bacterium]|jgi:hypothetical protein|nr:hypothetical protein [Spirochaetaceae bacterium]
MRKLMLILIALIGAVIFIRSVGDSLNAEEHPAGLEAAALAPDLTTQ